MEIPKNPFSISAQSGGKWEIGYEPTGETLMALPSRKLAGYYRSLLGEYWLMGWVAREMEAEQEKETRK